MKQLTIAVPAYNAENFLSKCLASTVIDRVKARLEVIVINDGSTDQTLIVAEEFSRRYPEIFRSINKTNGGHGSGINAAIEIATGRYFKVIDADDWVISKNLAELLDVIEITDVDVIINGFNTYDIRTGSRQYISAACNANNQILSLSQMMKLYDDIGSCCSLHGLTYRTDVYKSSGVILTEHVYYEDNEYAILPFSSVSSVMILDFPIYEYRVGDIEQSISIKNQITRVSDKETVILKILNCHHKMTTSKDSFMYFIRRVYALIMGYYVTTLIFTPDKKKGRQLASALNGKISEYHFLSRLHSKYLMLLLCSYLRISPAIYEKITKSRTVRKMLRKFLK